MFDFPASRAAALDRLNEFAPLMGKHYTLQRNYDLADGHVGVSRLSPYIRHRVISEREVIAKCLQHHSYSSAEKFIQEVFWRTYWKGWLAMRPQVWLDYMSGVKAALDQIQTQAGLRQDFHAACSGDTGIACFDHWARELATTGYLHNHARMWFASIWIFSLRLPWELGADFFMRHLLDGDAASNTLSWRWVAGRQTLGKTYLARADNIAKFTKNRFNPLGQLAQDAPPILGTPHPDRAPTPAGDRPKHLLKSALLLHDDDLNTPYWAEKIEPIAIGVCVRPEHRSPLSVSQNVTKFTAALAQDCTKSFDATTDLTPKGIMGWLAKSGADQLVMPFAPTGPNSEMVQAIRLACQNEDIPFAAVQRPYDALCWPHATAGFFKFKARIPMLISAMGLENPDQLALL